MKEILVVEDSKTIISLIKDKFNDHNGFRVHYAMSYSEAEEIIQKNKNEIEVALLDINLPDAPNGEVVTLVNTFNIPAIVLTSTLDKNLREQIQKLDIISYILKDKASSIDLAIKTVLMALKNSERTVLIVDDSKSLRAILTDILKRIKLNVLEAKDGEEALKVLKKNAKFISLVIVDYEMPKMNGLDLTSNIRELYGKDEIGIIAMSTASKKEIIDDFLTFGANDFISKPLSVNEVTTRINLNLELIDLFAQKKEISLILKEKVKEKTKELSQANKALEELNKTLELRVQTEINKNIEKDKIMIAQSRQVAMGDMVSMLAHQWRQPITSMGMALENMKLDIELGEVDLKRFDNKLSKIVKQIHYLSKTIDDFRDFLKPHVKPVKCKISSIINDTINIIGKSLESSNIKVKESYEDIEVVTYKNELVQVLLNILNNAKDVIKLQNIENGKIWIKVTCDNNVAKFEILDNGGGISEDIINKIFEPYFSIKDEKSGKGLGLYISKMLIKKHIKGDISVKNINKGACFTVSIPIKK